MNKINLTNFLIKKFKLNKESFITFIGQRYLIFQWPQKLFNNKVVNFERIIRFDNVGIIATTKVNNQNKIILIYETQPHFKKKWFYNIVCGSCETWDEKTIDCAKRELVEETGYKGELKLFKSNLNYEPIGYSNWYISKNCKKIAEQSLDIGGEKIKVKLVSWTEFTKLIKQDTFREVSFKKWFNNLSKKEETNFKKLIFD
jgi:ADP-ribose pyrophosphatase YjhB (NUDIX family)